MPGESVKDGPGGARQQVLLVTGLLGAGKGKRECLLVPCRNVRHGRAIDDAWPAEDQDEDTGDPDGPG